MKDAISQIVYWYRLYYADGFFLIMAIFSYLYLFVHEKNSRKCFLYPVALLAFCVVNPALYWLVFRQIIYWRLFWVIPDAIIIAYAVTKMVQNSQRRTDKIIVLVIFAVFVLVKGTNVYKNGGFSVIQNLEKVSKPVEEVCAAMLEIEESPRCILPAPLLSEARQYSGEIQSLYGRNVDGYIIPASGVQMEIYHAMERPVSYTHLTLPTMATV